MTWNWKSSQDAKKAAEIIEKIKDLTKNGSIHYAPQYKELSDALAELEEVRKGCYHEWEVILLFSRHRKFCKICQKEDASYVHES